MSVGKKLPRGFFLRDSLEVARELIGKQLVRVDQGAVTAGVIVEAEAYRGKEDPAAHSFRGPADGRTRVMYQEGGAAYLYLIYGMHTCMNVVANRAGVPHAVLIRALEPKEGIPLMMERRGVSRLKSLCNGPGKLCKAMGITMDFYGEDLLGDRLYLTETPGIPDFHVQAAPRINVDYAGDAKDFLYRFIMEGSPFLSVKE